MPARWCYHERDKHVPLGIYGHSGHFAEVHVAGKLQEIWNRTVRNFWDRSLLSLNEDCGKKYEGSDCVLQ